MEINLWCLGFRLIGGQFSANELVMCFYTNQKICNGKSVGSSKNLTNSYNSSSSSYRTTLGSFEICPCRSPFLFSINTTNIGSSWINNIKYFSYSRSFAYDEQPNCSTPLGTKSPWINAKHGQPHGYRIVGSCGSIIISYAI